MTEPCLDRRGSLIGSSFQLYAVRGLLGFTSCPENAIFRKWGLLQMWGSSILNEQANCSERVFGKKICAQECMETTGGEGLAMVHSVPWVCMSNVWGPQCMGAGEATAGENWSLQDKSPKTHPCGDSADVRFQNCKQIQKQSGRNQEGFPPWKSVEGKKLDVCQR